MTFEKVSNTEVRVTFTSDEVASVNMLSVAMNRTDFNCIGDFLRIHLGDAQNHLDCNVGSNCHGNPFA